MRAGEPAGELICSLGTEVVLQVPLYYQSGASDDRAPKGWLARLFGM